MGFALDGLRGAIIGLIIGTILDHLGERRREKQHEGARPDPRAPQGDIITSLVVLTAAIMKADGKVTHRELDHVRRFFVAQFGIMRAGELLIVLRDVLKQDVPVEEVCTRNREYMPYPVRLQLMHYLVGLAHADGRMERPELQLLERMAAYMGISARDLGSLSAMFRMGDPSAAYDVLEIPPDVPDDEVKKAYRRMAVKYHPDKVAQLGEDVQKAAEEKFKKVQEAYETIKKQRGMS